MNKHPFSDFTAKQLAGIDQAVREYSGMSDHLSSALGALVMGQYVGWRGLLVVHNRATVKRYEQILGIEFKDYMPERTEQTERLLGIRIADKLGKFWAVVKQEIAIPEGKAYMDAEGQDDLFPGRPHGRAT